MYMKYMCDLSSPMSPFHILQCNTSSFSSSSEQQHTLPWSLAVGNAGTNSCGRVSDRWLLWIFLRPAGWTFSLKILQMSMLLLKVSAWVFRWRYPSSHFGDYSFKIALQSLWHIILTLLHGYCVWGRWRLLLERELHHLEPNTLSKASDWIEPEIWTA